MGARRDSQQWGVHGNTDINNQSRKEVQFELFKLLGVRINEPRAGNSYFLHLNYDNNYFVILFFYAGGAGSSDTGNIGWKLVQHAAEIAPIIFKKHVPLEAAQQLFEGLGHFLIAINSKFVLDPVKLGRLCAHVDRLMIQCVPWHPGVPRLESFIKKAHN